MRHIEVWRHIFFYQKTSKYFNDFQNWSFSVLWLKRIQTMELEQNQTFFHGTYSNLMSYLFLLKTIKKLQWLEKSNFLSFMTKMNPNNGNETKSDIFHWYIFKSEIIFVGWKILKYFNDFYKEHLLSSLQNWAQLSKMK